MWNLGITEWTAIISVVISTCSMVFSAVNIRQNNRMIEDQSRPYVSIYLEWIKIRENWTYLILKNFGNSGCTIQNIKYSLTPEELKYFYIKNQYEHYPFENLEGSFLAPGQAILATISVESLDKLPDQFKISVKYKGVKEYEDSFLIRKNYEQGSLVMRNKIDNCDQAAQVISDALHEMSERLM